MLRYWFKFWSSRENRATRSERGSIIASFITDLVNLNLIKNKKTLMVLTLSITTELETNSESDIDPKNTFITPLNIETSSTNEIRQLFC